MSDSEQTPERWFHERATLYVEAQILFHLSQVGVIPALAEADGPRSSNELATARGLNARILDVLLEYVCGVDSILTRTDAGYSLTDFGRAVVARYSKQTEDGVQVNFFDVRTGAYGPVWAKLSGMLTGEEVYGETLHRAGTFAERGLYTSARRMAPALLATLPEGSVPVVELGVETGLLECVGRARPELQLFGLDRNTGALRKCAELASREGIDGIGWVEGDLFEPATWASQLPAADTGVFYTIHLHEFVAAGRDRMVELFRTLASTFPGWTVVALEQPKLDDDLRDQIPQARWLYGQSNILIHHLIKNGQILSRASWIEIFEDAGTTIQSASPTGYLDYIAFVVRLGGGAGAP